MRRFHLVLGYASLALGGIGIVLPVLPTTPFIILAAWCFARSNPALADWLYNHPHFGALLVDWRDQGAIPLRAKIFALSALACSYAFSVWFIESRYLPFVMAAIMGSVAVYIVTRPRPRPRAQMADDQNQALAARCPPNASSPRKKKRRKAFSLTRSRTH